MTMGRTLKEELREAHEKRFSNYTRRPFSALSADATTLKLYDRLFALLAENAANPLVRRQTPVRDLLVAGDTAHFQRVGCSQYVDDGMWIYLQPDSLSIVLLCCDTETRDTYVEHLGDPLQRFELTEIWAAT
jgi:hypothetical protein